jgi:hypothetical protein
MAGMSKRGLSRRQFVKGSLQVAAMAGFPTIVPRLSSGKWLPASRSMWARSAWDRFRERTVFRTYSRSIAPGPHRDPERESFKNDDEANAMLSRSRRQLYTLIQSSWF